MDRPGSSILSRRPDLVIAGTVAIVAAALFLPNLGNQYLWQDEAQTALIARTVLASGMPLGTDGKNFFSQELGAEYGSGHVWRWHTWLPFYLLAAFFAVGGQSAFVARLPFALAGIATVVAVYFLGRDLWRSRRAGVAAALLVATSVPFLVLSRQCRYYSLSALFAVLALHAYLGIAARRPWAVPMFVAAATLLFHTHHLYFPALLVAVVADALVFRRGAAKRVALACGIAIALNTPWIVWFAGMSYGQEYDTQLAKPAVAWMFTRKFLEQLGQYAFPPLLLAVPVALAWLPWRRPKGAEERRAWLSPAALLVLFTAANLVAFSVTAPAPFFRYLAPLLPVASLLAAGIVEGVMKRQKVLGIAVLVATVLAVQPLANYLHEITHDFDGPIEGIVRHLREHARPGDVVAITYGDLPVKFYTDLRVVGGLTGEDLTPALGARWVIRRRHLVSQKDQAVDRYLVQNLPWRKYRRIEIPYPDTAFENRESPQEHRYRTATGEAPVVIWERVVP